MTKQEQTTKLKEAWKAVVQATAADITAKSQREQLQVAKKAIEDVIIDKTTSNH